VNFEFSWTDFLKILKIPNFMKIRQVEAELFYADGRTDRQTDMTKLTIAIRSFANAPKNHFLTLSAP